MSRVQKLIVLLLLMIVAACNPSPQSGAKQIGSEGGTVHGMLDDGIKVTLSVPKGAVEADTAFTLTLKEPDEVGLPDSFPLAGGYVMELGPDGAAFHKQPVLLEVGPADEDDANESRGRLYYRNEAKHLWEPAEVASFDRKTGNVTYRLEHFSPYALLNANVRVDYVDLTAPIVPGQEFFVDVGLTHMGESGWFTQFRNNGEDVTVRAYLHADSEELQIPQHALPGSFTVPFGQSDQVWPDVTGGIAHDEGTVMVLEILADISGSSDQWVIFERDLLSDLPNSSLTGSYSSSQELLTAYAPILEFAPGEPYRPISVDYILRKAEEFKLEDPVWGRDDVREDTLEWTLPNENEDQRLISRAGMLARYGSNRSFVDFDGQGSQFRFGTGGVSEDDLTLYARATEHDLGAAFGGIGDALVLSYFMIYPFDQKYEWTQGIGHTGDRESISVVLDIDGGQVVPDPKAVAFGQHLPGHYMEADFGDDVVSWRGDVLTLSWPSVNSVGNHVVGYVAYGSHAVYPRPGPKRVIVTLAGTLHEHDEVAGGGVARLKPEPLSSYPARQYTLLEAPSSRSISSSGTDGWRWMLYPGGFVRGEVAGVDVALLGNVPIIPFLDRWYDPGSWLLGGSTVYVSTLRHGLGAKDTWGPISYGDVPSSSWFSRAVSSLSYAGIVSGDPGANSFRPEADINRAEFLKMVIAARSAGNDNQSLLFPTLANESFSDVSIGDWFRDYVVVAVHHGIIDNGSAANNYLFRPADSLTRAEAAKMVVVAFGLTGPVLPADNFPDVVAGSWYESYVRIAAKHGVVEGYDDGTFKPANNINRAEAAAIVWRAYKRGAN